MKIIIPVHEMKLGKKAIGINCIRMFMKKNLERDSFNLINNNHKTT